MYQYIWDEETGGSLLITEISKFSKEPRPVYYRELDILGFDKYWNYPKDDRAPLMWAEANNYIYFGRTVAKTKGGSLYTAPEIILLEDPEPDGGELRFVDIERMVAKNAEIMETLTQETIRNVYNTYKKYQKKVDLFYVAFSGGKDSVVALDIVQRALPHDNFVVLFGDTQMEFSDTYDVVDKIQKWCEVEKIRFYRSKSKYTPEFTWNAIGPPAQKMRWCCSVHKTAPQILLLRELTKNPHFRGMAMMGVRADESVTRSRYEELNFGTKHQGQYNYYPILNWSSTELFIYIYMNKLIINETYKKGNSRAGCLVCPMEADKNTWFKSQLYSETPEPSCSTSFFYNIVKEKTVAKELSADNLHDFMDVGIWKTRYDSSKLYAPLDIFHEEYVGSDLKITIDRLSTDWHEWIKTVGDINYISHNTLRIYVNEKEYTITYSEDNNRYVFVLKNVSNEQKDIYFVSWIKTVLRKSAFCIRCQVCEANCPNGYIHMHNNSFCIDDKCVKCKKCYNVDQGCVVAASHRVQKERKKMKGSPNQYTNLGVKYSWVVDYLSQTDSFWDNNGLGSKMTTNLKKFLQHAGVLKEKSTDLTKLGELIVTMGGESVVAWALMLCNLVYTPQFYWWLTHIDFNHVYSPKEIEELLSDQLSGAPINHASSAFKHIFYTNPILSNDIGFGCVTVEKKGANIILVDASRTPWTSPDSRVILYSLYKFAENCGGDYQFSLSMLLDDTIERDGISPTRIFGLDRDTMVRILNGLSINYGEFISASFTLGLDTITLQPDKTSQDVLILF